MIHKPTMAAVIMLGVPMCLLGCTPTEPNELGKLGTVAMTINKQAFELWVADTADERERGLMFIKKAQMAPKADGTKRGMVFIFDHDERGSFWMKNTIIPLDIAYVRADGTVDSTHTMVPLDARPNRYPPDGPYRFAIEFNGNVLKALGVKAGDKLDIPTSVSNRKRK